jgi:hypothetical protein
MSPIVCFDAILVGNLCQFTQSESIKSNEHLTMKFVQRHFGLTALL